MTSQLRYDDKVAIVTGAGAGLGRSYALLLASRGAQVVVNDLGGSAKGEGSSQKAADIVVNEIKAAGGSAVADYNSVEDAEKVVKTALDTFGRVDILVNNAGILRDRSLVRTSNTDWDLVHRVHLRGSFLMTREAFPHMKKQGFGRIIMTTSAAGIYGNFGQSNYSAAKLGLLGLSNTVAIEGQKYNIHCNTIAPMGATRLTEGIIPPDIFNELKPEHIAPIVAWLCHEDCEETGSLFEAAAGWFGKYRWERSSGAVCRKSLNDSVSIESVKNSWDQICDFTNAQHLGSINEATMEFFGVIENLKENNGGISNNTTSNSNVSGPMNALGASISPQKYSYNVEDVILYALGVGVSTKDESYLKFLYEGSVDFSVLPSFIVVPTQGVLFSGDLFENIKGYQMDLSKLLHGEQYIEIVKALPPSANLHTAMTITDVLDKGSGAVIVVDGETTDDSGEVISKTQWSLFLVGEGNFGGPRSSDKIIPLIEAPKRAPDAVEEFKTSVDQAALYRLSGDKNPLHIDPDFAAIGGFSEPILHGLCSYGISCRAVLKHFCNDDVTRFKAMKTRFARPVIPGQTLVTEMWKEGDRIFMKTHVKETGKPSLTGGYVDLHPNVEEKKEAPKLASVAVFDKLKDKIAQDPSYAKKVKGIVLWNINVDGKMAYQWTMDLKNPPGALHSGLPPTAENPDVTLTIEDSDMVALADGKLNAQKAFMTGKLKVKGNVMLTQKLGDILKTTSKI